MEKLIPETMTQETVDIVKRMAWMAEYRNPATANHLERVRAYVSTLAVAVGLDASEAELLSVAAMLHDIGKVGLPDTLMLRVGNLTSNELELTKRHTTIGYDILKDAPLPVLQTAASICLSHHERWDGSGYPQGLLGEKIPLAGRLCGMADVFDALTTPRAYKKELSVVEARNLIAETSGRLFDPDLVRVFCENIDTLSRLRLANLKDK